MKNGAEMCSGRSCTLSAALIAGMICGMSAPAFADSDRPMYVVSKNTVSSQQPSKADRMQALEYARIAFDRARAAGGEKAAPYEYYMAEAYFKLAKAEFDEADQIGVIPFSEESKKYSLMVMEKMNGGSR
jgi:hypothetical protein